MLALIIVYILTSELIVVAFIGCVLVVIVTHLIDDELTGKCSGLEYDQTSLLLDTRWQLTYKLKTTQVNDSITITYA